MVKGIEGVIQPGTTGSPKNECILYNNPLIITIDQANSNGIPRTPVKIGIAPKQVEHIKTACNASELSNNV